MDQSVWKEAVRADIHIKNLGSCNRYERRVCAKKEKSVFTVKGRKRGSTGVYTRITEEGIYSTFKVALNSTSVLCRKEEW